MPLETLFKKTGVAQIETIVAERPIDEKEHRGGLEKQGRQAAAGTQAYQSAKQLPQTHAVVFAEQIMSSPVVTLGSQATVDEGMTLFRTKQFRHLPVISSAGKLIGMVSDRDILRHLGSVTENYQSQVGHSRDKQVDRLMTSPVLTASGDTDVRYIARLFVERRVGALPIITDGELRGIVARSDVLKAVMRHFSLELWV